MGGMGGRGLVRERVPETHTDATPGFTKGAWMVACSAQLTGRSKPNRFSSWLST